MALEGSDPESLLTVRLTGRANDVQITLRSSRPASGGNALALFAGGLIVAEEVIREHAGELYRSSSLGAGTQFRVVLPRRKPWAPR
jgi:signal transduction histidine kinase